MRKAVYAGSFDPITLGHLWMIDAGAGLFDELIVAVGVNPAKRYTFDTAERMAMIRESAPHLPNLTVTEFTGRYLVHFAQDAGATYILRGIRSPVDFHEEMTIRHVNDDIAALHQPRVESPPTTVFLMPPRRLAEVSSSLVKGLVRADRDWEPVVRGYVPEPVMKRLSLS